jgi:hypothetical protein
MELRLDKKDSPAKQDLASQDKWDKSKIMLYHRQPYGSDKKSQKAGSV